MQHGLFGSVDLLEAALKTLLYLGLLLLVGSGVVSRFIGPELLGRQSLTLRVTLLLGAALIAGSSLTKGWVEANGLGVSPAMYFFETQQGNITLARLAFLVGLLVLGLQGSQLDRWLYPLISLGLLLSVSLISHSGASRSWPLFTGWLHLSAATVWAGSLMVMAWCWEGNAREVQLAVVHRLSRLGLVAVGVLMLAGFILSMVLVNSLSNVDSAYGFSLFRKLFFVLPVFLVAGLNRFVVLPRLREGGPVRAMGHMLFLESWLILLVLVFTGLLSSTPPPGARTLAFESNPNDVTIEEAIGNQRVIGRLYNDQGLTYLTLRFTNRQGEVSPQGPMLSIVATNAEGKRVSTKDFPIGGARYAKALQLDRGDWSIAIEWPGRRLEYSINVP
jgi:putative copper export protein